MPLASATRVGPYEIVSTLGGGAMGEVYLAHDPRLSRKVALKILPSGSPTDSTRRRRFVQEARSASSLNHPNIVTIHDFGTVDGISYLVTELVEGESLRALIQRGSLPMRRLMDLAVQIADGLAAAHEAGIVHRDLKPENLMVTPNGRVKILDFGLAKPILMDSEGPEEADELAQSTFDGGGTEPGLILGTVGYMSPEQARGAPVSFQSDQFSLGLVLHELATGQQAFRRETPMQTLLAIANVDRVPFTPGPVAFRLLVEKCLSKNPRDRFDATREIHQRLLKIQDQLPDRPAAAIEAQPQQLSDEGSGERAPGLRLPLSVPPRVRRAAAAALSLAAIAAALWVLLPRIIRGTSDMDLASAEFTPLVSTGGIDVFPAFSPQAEIIAYAEAEEGTFQIFTRRLGSPLSTRLTAGPYDCLFPFWSADGTRVYYISQGALWAAGSAAGSPELVIDNVAQAAASPDGRTLALIRREGDAPQSYALWIASAGAPPRRFDRPPFRDGRFSAPSYLKFSSDGKTLALWISRASGGAEFWSLPWPGGAPRKYLEKTPPAAAARPFTWMPDSRRILFAEAPGMRREQHLWLADVQGGTARRVTNGTGREQAPSMSPDGRQAAFSALDLSYDLARFPLDGSPAATSAYEARPSSPFSNASPAWSPKRPEFAYVTDRNGAPEIWLRDSRSGWERLIASAKDFHDATSSILDLSFSPDGQRIAYTRAGEGQEAIWISTLTGEAPARLVDEPGHGVQRGPSWAPDGNWIAYFSIRDGKYVALKARAGSAAAPSILRAGAGTYPVWSPKGDSIAALNPDGGLNIISADGSTARRLGTGAWLAAAWASDGRRIFGMRNGLDRKLTFASVELDGGTESAIADLGWYPAAFSYGQSVNAYPVRGASISPDGKTFLTSMLHVRSDIWLLKGFGPLG